MLPRRRCLVKDFGAGSAELMHEESSRRMSNPIKLFSFATGGQGENSLPSYRCPKVDRLYAFFAHPNLQQVPGAAGLVWHRPGEQDALLPSAETALDCPLAGYQFPEVPHEFEFPC